MITNLTCQLSVLEGHANHSVPSSSQGKVHVNNLFYEGLRVTKWFVCLQVERAHQVAMILDPQIKLRSVPAYQHEDIISRACEMATETRDGGMTGGGGSGGEDRDTDGPPTSKISRIEGAGSNGGTSRRTPSCTVSGNDEGQSQVRQEIFQYLAEPLLQGTPDLLQYWSSAVGDKFPRLSRLALWLLAVPAVGIRGECVTVCEQSLAMKRRQQVTTEEMNKLIFLRSNMG